jgi:hypothetical protein
MDLFENRRKGQRELTSIRHWKRECAAKVVFTKKIGCAGADFARSVKKYPDSTGIPGCTGQKSGLPSAKNFLPVRKNGDRGGNCPGWP